MEAKPDVVSQLSRLNEQLAEMSQQLAFLAEKQRERDELFHEMQPVLKAVMEHATKSLQKVEERGYFTFARELSRVLDRVVEGYDEQDVSALGDNIVRIMDTVRAYTQPQVLALANEATDVIDHADELEPTGIFGMVRASRDEDVQRGMAVFLGILRSVGRGVKAVASDRRPQRRVRSAPLAELPASGATPARAVSRAAMRDTGQAAAPVVIDGVAFDAQGYVAEPSQWTPELGGAIAASLGVSLTDVHWATLMAARNDYLENGMSPNIRRLTKVAGITTKELYRQFPKAPGMTVARVAGIPKPAGCI